jgi:hypothetical protein
MFLKFLVFTAGLCVGLSCGLARAYYWKRLFIMNRGELLWWIKNTEKMRHRDTLRPGACSWLQWSCPPPSGSQSTSGPGEPCGDATSSELPPNLLLPSTSGDSGDIHDQAFPAAPAPRPDPLAPHLRAPHSPPVSDDRPDLSGLSERTPTSR